MVKPVPRPSAFSAPPRRRLRSGWAVAALALAALASCQGDDRAAHQREVLFSKGGLLGPQLEVVAGRDRVFGAKVALEVGRRPMVAVWLPLDEAEAWAEAADAMDGDGGAPTGAPGQEFARPDEEGPPRRAVSTAGELGATRAVLEPVEGPGGPAYRLEAFQRDGEGVARVELDADGKDAAVRAVREAVRRLREPR